MKDSITQISRVHDLPLSPGSSSFYFLPDLAKQCRGKKRIASRTAVQLTVASTVNACWSIDYMSDSLFCGIRFTTFNVVDDCSREALVIEIDIGLPSEGFIKQG